MIPEQQEAYDELTSYLDIEGVNIDQASIRQPVLFEMVCTETADAYRRYSERKLELERQEAQTKLDTRRRLAETGEKSTEGKIEEIVEADPALFTIKKEVLELETIHFKWNQLKRAYEMRNDSIKVNSNLINSGYVAYS